MFKRIDLLYGKLSVAMSWLVLLIVTIIIVMGVNLVSGSGFNIFVDVFISFILLIGITAFVVLLTKKTRIHYDYIMNVARAIYYDSVDYRPIDFYIDNKPLYIDLNETQKSVFIDLFNNRKRLNGFQFPSSFFDSDIQLEHLNIAIYEVSRRGIHVFLIRLFKL